MNKTYLIVIAAALLATPLGFAHPPMGTPKSYCEPTSEWDTHDYGPGTLNLLTGLTDGNVLGKCKSVSRVDPGVPCAGFYDFAHPGTFYGGLCGSTLDPPFADHDGHSEYALGGAVLLVESGAGFYGSSGSLFCYGEPGHHPAFPYVLVEDFALGVSATYTVGADYGFSGTLPERAYAESPRKPTASLEVAGDGGSCGDGIVDVWYTCADSWWLTCAPVGFPPGLDGAYYVFVEGTYGHVTTL